MNMILNEAQVSLLERQAAAEYPLASARMLQAETKKLELENELLAIEVEEKRAEAQMREAERISSSTYAKQSPPDVYYAWRAMGEPRALNMAQTLQSAHTMRGGKLSEHAALQWGDVERSGLLEDIRVVERSPRAVVLDIKRRGRSPQCISWTIEDAQRAGIANFFRGRIQRPSQRWWACQSWHPVRCPLRPHAPALPPLPLRPLNPLRPRAPLRPRSRQAPLRTSSCALSS